MLGGFAPLPLRLSPVARTGWSASAHARAAADLVAAKRTAPLAVLTYTSSGGGVTLHNCWSMVEIGTVSAYAPTLTRSATGVVLVTFPVQVADEYDISGTLCIRGARATLNGTTAGLRAIEIVSPNSVRVRTFDSSGVAADRKVTLKVF